MKSRRSFIYNSALAAAGLGMGLPAGASLLPTAKADADNGKSSALKISVFSKNLQWLSYEAMADEVAKLGFDGVDLTVRPKGHVLPENVERDLPKAVAALRRQGLEVYMITTAISSASAAYTEDILRAAARAGITYYRLGWFSYNKALSGQQNISAFNQTLLQLQQLNKKYKLHAAYQNHAGESFGSPVIDFAMALQGVDPEYVGCQYDIRHATVEGANSWPIGLNLVKDYIRTINIKDFAWQRVNGKWKEENVPLGQGMVDFSRYLTLLKQFNFQGPVCIHYEYPLGGAEDGATTLSIPAENVFAAMRKDLQTFKGWLATAGF